MTLLTPAVMEPEKSRIAALAASFRSISSSELVSKLNKNLIIPQLERISEGKVSRIS